MDASQQKSFDVVVAGGGCSGILTAARLADAHPDIKILVIEKEEALGGRLRSNKPGATRHSYGLNAINTRLFDFWNQSLKSDPEAPELDTLINRRHNSFGSLSGGKILEAPVTDWLTGKGSRVLGGYAAKRQWPKMKEVIDSVLPDDDDEDDDDSKVESFGSMWKLARKAPAAIVMNHYSKAFGIPDLWGASTKAVAERGKMLESSLHCGNFERALEILVEHFGDRVQIVKDCWVINAELKEIKEGSKDSSNGKIWSIETPHGVFTTPSLVVAQPPWQALEWLKRDLWPTSLLSIVSKTKPVSIVTLSAVIESGEAEIPEVIIVPSERVQVIRNSENEITFQATIDFEVSLQAPEVVKAVKALKRSYRKLQKQVEGLELSGEHLALMPYAWPQSASSKDHKFFTRMMKKPISSKELSFVGDAYSDSYDGDLNIINTVVGVCELHAE